MNETMVFAELLKIMDVDERQKLSHLIISNDVNELKKALVLYLKKYRAKMKYVN